MLGAALHSTVGRMASERSKTYRRGTVGFLLRDKTRVPRYWLRKLFRRRSAKLHGVLLTLPPGANARRRHSLLSERHERGVAYAVLAKLEPNDRVVEFGGGLGFISTLCAQRIGSSRVTSYEANPDAARHIHQTYERNGVSPRLVIGAIGASARTARFYRRGHSVASSLVPTPGERGAVEVRQYDVNIELRRRKPTFLIVDIEGAEAEVLGAAELVGVRKLMLEIHPRTLGRAVKEEMLRDLERRGFRKLSWLSRNRKIYYERTEEAAAETPRPGARAAPEKLAVGAGAARR